MKSARQESATKPEKPDIIAIHKDKTSELYAPKLRDGENPSRGHETINIQCRYLKRFHGLSILERYLASILQPGFLGFDYDVASKPREMKLCWRKNREKAIEEVKEDNVKSLTLKIPAPAPTPEPPSITKQWSDSEENLFQASLLLARLIKGRGIQTKKFQEFSKMASK